jgi:hypothetical protein
MKRIFMTWTAAKQCFLLLFAIVSSSVLFSQNPIITENALPGNPSSQWDITGSGSSTLQGFATDISVNKGQRINFKIRTSTVFTYTITIYRLGYYQGNGARLIANLGTVTGTVQPSPLSNASTGLVDCGNWSISSFWDVPSTAVSGFYIAKLTRTSDANVSSHIAFIVRDDGSTSDLFFQASDATWQAYNNYGGNSLYIGTTSFPNGHAAKVSYNRPVLTRAGGGGGGANSDWLFNAEYPMIRFLERNGYNVSYTTCVDAARRGNLILNHKVYLSVGHDEYWSAEQRTNVEAARNAGVHLAFFSGNEVYWKTRWENSIDGSNTAYRTLVCYKEGSVGELVCGSKCDPTTEWTGLWRDGCSFPSGGACKQETELTGQMSWSESTAAIAVNDSFKNVRFWRNTNVASLGTGQSVTMTFGTLGHEWDPQLPNGIYPSGRIILSSTIVGGYYHKLSMYRHPSGALVFGAGTVQWSWGLDNIHDSGNAPASPAMQQATVNLFADMGVQPGSLMAGLTATTASTDFTAPQTSIAFPVNGANLPGGTALTISGTASDAGGIVAGVEVSVDGGTTWKLATGTTNWTFSWTPTINGSTAIKVRGYDDSGNMGVPGAAGTSSHIVVTVGGGAPPACSTCTIFQETTVPSGIPRENDGGMLELGVKFRSTQAGYITGIRFYKATGVTGTHIGNLWSSTGTRLATVTFAGESASGWQQMAFSNPVAINANTTYVASYFSTSGDYISSNPYFNQAVVNGTLRALASGEDGANGLYKYASTSSFPTDSYQSSNYWVDVIYAASIAPDLTPPTVSGVSPANGATGVNTGTAITATFSEAINAATVTGTSVQLRDPGNNIITATLNTVSNVITLTPSAILSGSTTYTVTIFGGASGVKDAAGNSLANNFVWSFTTAAADITPPTVSLVSPANGTTGVSTGTVVTITFSETINAATVTGTTVQLRDPGNNLITATLNTSANVVTLTPGAPLNNSTVYTATITGGASGVKDLGGNALASNFVWTFTTGAAPAGPSVTIFQSSTTPASLALGNDGPNLELGLKFRSTQAGYITGIRFYKAVGVTGAHTGNLWSSTGTRLATVTFTGETSSGWQQMLFSTPVAIAANTTYIASYFSASGDYIVSNPSLTQAVVNTPLRALANGEDGPNGVFKYAATSTFPNDNWQSSNYWVDVVYMASVGPDVTPPTVTTVSPANNATGVSLSATITATFSEAISAASITGTTVQLKDAGNNIIAATLNTSSNIVTLTPSAALTNNMVYTVTLLSGASGVKDLAGNSLASNFVWSFSTIVGDIVPPTISTVSPVNGATGVSIGTTVSATFSEAVNAATITAANVELRGPGSTLVTATLNTSSNIVTLTPTAPLANATLYTATIKGGTTGVKDLAGNSLASDFVWSFTTTIGDIIPPTVSAVSPANGATGVVINTTVSATFNEAINAATVTAATVELRDAGNNLIPATLNTSSGVVTLTPSSPLANSTTFTLTIKGGSSGVKDLSGNALVNDFVSSFTTVIIDVTPPAISSVTPVDGATGVSLTTTVTATFNEAISAATITAANVQLKDAGNNTIAATLNTSSNVVTLTPSAALNNSIVYTVTIKGGTTGVKDIAGNALVNDFAWSFTTVADLIAPTVTTVSPTNGATGVSATTTVTATLSEAINASTVTGTTVQLKDPGNNIITATLNTSSNLITLTPSAALVNSAVYTVTIKGGTNGVKDLAGNALVNDFNWTFTTVSATGPAITIFQSSNTPASLGRENDGGMVELGVKFRTTQAGFVTGIRFYKASGVTGSHTGNLWSSTGTRLATVLFTGETSSGWQQMLFATPVAVNANTTYVASYFGTSGDYISTNPFFTQAVVNGPLRALATGEDGPNGVYKYASTSTFPNDNWQSSNYWVDVVFTATIAPDNTPPTVSSVTPPNGANGSTGVTLNPIAVATFSEDVNASTITATNFQLKDASNNVIAASLSTVSNVVTLTPSAVLNYSTIYTVTIRGGSTGVKDLAGNALVNDYVWSFTTPNPPTPPAPDGPGGPILVVSHSGNPFSRYSMEILKAEGLNEFLAKDISQVSESELNNYDVVVLGEMPLTGAQTTMFTNWVNGGGTLIAFRPDAQLSSLFGITKGAGTLPDKYLLVNTSSGPGAGIVNQTIQYHGTSDLYTLNGATSLATLYSSATTATSNHAVTSRNVGVNGGRAIAFAFDLARSIVYTRQGNPAWAGQERDGLQPIRSDDLFFGNAAGDPQPDWIDFNKVAIPQADEQQRLLANIILQNNMHRKPLPRFWYLPKGLKAAVVMTGDDHANNGTTSRFNQYLTMGPNTAQDVLDWNAVRGTSYIYPATAITNAQAVAFQAQGFEIALHPTMNPGGDCLDYTLPLLQNVFTTQLSQFRTKYTGIGGPFTSRNHCLVWSDWASTAKVSVQNGIRLDATYYNWPNTWMQNIPGMFTGSGMPMRFADLDGSIIDCYQLVTQMTDETSMNYTTFCNTILDRALGAEGYYGVFCANMHTDAGMSAGSDQIIASALARQVPVISAKQMLDWLDGRNASSFGSLSWNNYQLSFTVTAGTGARNLKAMVPVNAENGILASITRNGSNATFTTQTIKGMLYAFFDAPAGTNSFVATYTPTITPPVVITHPATQSVCAGSNAVFVSSASGGPAPTVQWQESTNGTDWSNIAGATNGTFTFAPVAGDNGKQYRAVWTNTQGTATSNASTLTINQTPAAPGVTVTNNCGSSLLTATGITGSVLWSNGATTTSITVTNAATYTVTQTVNGCVSPAGSGISAPLAAPAAPTISVTGATTFCQGGSVTLTSSAVSGNLWSNGATTQSIVVTTAGSYTVRFTNASGCISANSAARVITVNPLPALTSTLTPAATSGVTFSYTPTSTISGTTYSWTRAAVAGISNAASSGTGSISQILVNTTDAPVNVTYVYTLTGNGCVNTQNVVVSVVPRPIACTINSSITTTFNSTSIPAGRFIWFNCAFDPGTVGTTGAVNFYVTNSVITFTANSQQYTLNLPNSRIRFDANVASASTAFVNNTWQTAVPLTFNSYAFMGGLSYQVPSNLPGNISNVVWNATISIDRPSTSVTRRFSAAVYSTFAANSGLNIKPINGNTLNPYNNTNNAGTPENFKASLVAGAKSTGGTNYTGTYSSTSNSTCVAVPSGRSSGEPVQEEFIVTPFELITGLDVKVMPNPSSTYFTTVIKSNTDEPVTVKIVDMFGRVVERREKVSPNTVLQLGHQWKGSTYFAEFTQGDVRKVVKIIKL